MTVEICKFIYIAIWAGLLLANLIAIVVNTRKVEKGVYMNNFK